MIKKIAHLADIHLRKSPVRHDEYREVFENTYAQLKIDKPDRIVLVGDANLIHTISRPSDTQNDTVSYGRLTLPFDYISRHIFTTTNRSWILCYGRFGKEGVVVEWDGFSQTYNEIHKLYLPANDRKKNSIPAHSIWNAINDVCKAFKTAKANKIAGGTTGGVVFSESKYNDFKAQVAFKESKTTI